MDGFSTLVENQTAVDAWVHFWILSYISFVYRNCVYPQVITALFGLPWIRVILKTGRTSNFVLLLQNCYVHSKAL